MLKLWPRDQKKKTIYNSVYDLRPNVYGDLFIFQMLSVYYRL